MRPIELPDIVRAKAVNAGAERWLDDLPRLVGELQREWRIELGGVLAGGSEAYVAEAIREDGSPAILKVLIPAADGIATHEIAVLRHLDGRGCARLYEGDDSRSAMLLERLGAPLSKSGRDADGQFTAMVETVEEFWQPAPQLDLQTGAEKARWLIDYIRTEWGRLGQPCSERAIAYAIACAERREAAHDPVRAVLVHGDIHTNNTLAAGDGYKFIDPDGLAAEPEYDLGVIMREEAIAPSTVDPHARSRWLAARTGLDVTAIWEWSVVERVSTALVCAGANLQPFARDLLATAEAVADREGP